MQVEWTSYITSLRALLNEHSPTAYIGGITYFDIVEVYLPERTVRQLGFVQAIAPAPMRAAHDLRPTQGTYSVTFASPPIYTEACSRFLYCARVADQALRWAFVPSEADPSYVGWFRVSSHPYLFPDEGPSVSFGPAIVELNTLVFQFICFLLCVCII